MSEIEVSISVVPLSEDDGGGYLASSPNAPGCYGDGDTPEGAVLDFRDALIVWTPRISPSDKYVEKPRLFSRG